MKKPGTTNRIQSFLPGDARRATGPQSFEAPNSALGHGLYEYVVDPRDMPDCRCPSTWTLSSYSWCEREFFGWYRFVRHTQSCRKAGG